MAELKAGAEVDGFLLVRPLGDGPFGVVWQAQDRKGGQVALKLLKPHVLEQPSGKATFQRLLAAIKAYGELDHACLAKVLRSVQAPEKGALGIASEHLEGQTLDRMQINLGATSRAVDVPRLLRLLTWFEHIGRAVAWLHERGVVHGNLKPSNVMIFTGGPQAQLKILDLCWSAIGVARPAAGVETFLAPEQLEGNPPTVASDQFAVALMLSRFLSAGGRRLSREDGLPERLASALERATDKSARARFPSISDFVEALRSVRKHLAQEPGASKGLTPASGDRERPLAGAVPAAELAEDVETVRVPVHKEAPRPDKEAARPAPRAKPAELEPLAARGPPERSGLTGVEIEVVEPSAAVAVAIDASNPSEPGLLGSVELEPEIDHTARRPAEKRGAPVLMIAGGASLLLAILIVVGISRWSDGPRGGEAAPHAAGAAADAALPPPALAQGTAADASAPPARPAERPDAGAPPRGVEQVSAAAARPAADAGAGRVERGKKRRERAGGAGDEQADEAMARLEALAGGAEPRPAGDGVRLEVGCDEGDGAACHKLGETALAAGSTVRAQAAFERACSFSRAPSCARAADLAKRAGERKKAQELYERACAELGEACHDAAALEDDPARRAALEADACRRGRKASCAEVETSSTGG